MSNSSFIIRKYRMPKQGSLNRTVSFDSKQPKTDRTHLYQNKTIEPLNKMHVTPFNIYQLNEVKLENDREKFRSDIHYLQTEFFSKIRQINYAYKDPNKTSFKRLVLSMQALKMLSKKDFFMSSMIKPIYQEIYKGLFLEIDKIANIYTKQISDQENELIVEDQPSLPFCLLYNVLNQHISELEYELDAVNLKLIAKIQDQERLINKKDHEITALRTSLDQIHLSDSALREKVEQLAEGFAQMNKERNLTQYEMWEMEKTIQEQKEMIDQLHANIEHLEAQNFHLTRENKAQAERIEQMQQQFISHKLTVYNYQNLILQNLIKLQQTKENEIRLEENCENLYDQNYWLLKRAGAQFEEYTPRPNINQIQDQLHIPKTQKFGSTEDFLEFLKERYQKLKKYSQIEEPQIQLLDADGNFTGKFRHKHQEKNETTAQTETPANIVSNIVPKQENPPPQNSGKES